MGVGYTELRGRGVRVEVGEAGRAGTVIVAKAGEESGLAQPSNTNARPKKVKQRKKWGFFINFLL